MIKVYTIEGQLPDNHVKARAVLVNFQTWILYIFNEKNIFSIKFSALYHEYL